MNILTIYFGMGDSMRENLRINSGSTNILKVKNSFASIKKQDSFKGTAKINGESVMLEEALIKDGEKTITVLNQGQEEETSDQKEASVTEGLKKAIDILLGRDEAGKQKYEKILEKMQKGEDLSIQELIILKENNPEAYREYMMEKQAQEVFKERLKHCKNKDEATTVYIQQCQMISKVCGMSSEGGEKNKEKYIRMMKQTEKIWKAYQEGKLDNEEEKEKNAKQEELINELINTSLIYSKAVSLYDSEA